MSVLSVPLYGLRGWNPRFIDLDSSVLTLTKILNFIDSTNPIHFLSSHRLNHQKNIINEVSWTVGRLESYKIRTNELIFADGGDKATMSSKDLTKYYRPYQMNKKYNLYNGYTFYQAHYLSPFSVQEMKLCSPDGSVANTYLYQNIYWPTTANGEAEK